VWVTTPATHDVRRVDPATREVTTIKLDPIADPTHIEAGLGALWVDCWGDAFARIDGTTGESTPIYMPETSKSGYGFAIGDGGAWALNRQRGIIYPLNRRTGEVDGDGTNLGGAAIDAVATGGIVYILMKANVLAKFDERTRTLYDSIRLPARPVGIEREGSKLVIAFGGNRFATYQAGSLRRTTLLGIGRPWGSAEVLGHELWVTSDLAIYRLDTGTGDRLGDPISFKSPPVALNFEPSGRAWVGLESGALVSVEVPTT